MELGEEFYNIDKEIYNLPEEIEDIPTISDDYQQYEEEYDEVDRPNLISFKQREQMTLVREGEELGGLMAENKALRSLRQRQLISAREILFSTYKKVEDKNKVVKRYQKLENIDFLNAGLMVGSTVFCVENKELTRKNLEEFKKRYKSGELDEDLIRYIQMIYRET